MHINRVFFSFRLMRAVFSGDLSHIISHYLTLSHIISHARIAQFTQSHLATLLEIPAFLHGLMLRPHARIWIY